MRELAQLLLPSVRWDPALGFAPVRAAAVRLVASGIGGFVIEGGSCDDVAAFAAGIRTGADVAPIVAVATATLTSTSWREQPLPLPPLGAIASLRDLIAVRRAGRAAAREALRGGCNALLGPSCDVSVAPDSDTFARDATEVAVAAAEWIDAAQAEGVLCIAGRFPGAGRISAIASGVPVVRDSDDALYASDLVPFRAAIDAGVAGLLIAEAAYPSLDDTQTAALLSRPILSRLLRNQLGFDGLAVADAAALSVQRRTRVAASQLISAGIDLVLRPPNADAELRTLLDALESRQLDRERVHDAARRVRARAEMAGSAATAAGQSVDDEWLDEVAERAVAVIRGRSVHLGSPIDVVVSGESSDGRGLVTQLAEGIGEADGEVSGVRHATMPGGGTTTTLVLVMVPPTGPPAASAAAAPATEHARSICAEARRLRRDVVAVWCGHPASAPAIPDATLVIACWSPSRAMLRAAGRWLLRRV